jgi:hypothetical protein
MKELRFMILVPSGIQGDIYEHLPYRKNVTKERG